MERQRTYSHLGSLCSVIKRRYVPHGVTRPAQSRGQVSPKHNRHSQHHRLTHHPPFMHEVSGDRSGAGAVAAARRNVCGMHDRRLLARTGGMSVITAALACDSERVCKKKKLQRHADKKKLRKNVFPSRENRIGLVV